MAFRLHHRIWEFIMAYEFLMALMQLGEGSHTDTGKWFLLSILGVMLIGGLLLVVRGLRDLREDVKSRETETGREDRRKAA